MWITLGTFFDSRLPSAVLVDLISQTANMSLRSVKPFQTLVPRQNHRLSFWFLMTFKLTIIYPDDCSVSTVPCWPPQSSEHLWIKDQAACWNYENMIYQKKMQHRKLVLYWIIPEGISTVIIALAVLTLVGNAPSTSCIPISPEYINIVL